MTTTARLATAVLALIVGGCAWVERVSVPSGHPVMPGNAANAGSGKPAVSDGGRFVAFASAATNLVSDDNNGVADVFVRDLVYDTTERVSVSSAGIEGTLATSDPSISDDGQFIAFLTKSQLSDDDTDTANDVYVHDRSSHTTMLRSTDLGPLPAPFPPPTDSIPFHDPVISGDGTTIAFNAAVTYLGVQVRVGPYVRRAAAPATFMTQGQLFPAPASLSDDGTRVAWTSILPTGTDAQISSVIADTTTNSLVAAVDGGYVTHQSQGGFSIFLSGDGGHAVTTRTARFVGDILSYDIATNVLTPVVTSVSSISRPTISDDGTRIVFGGQIDAQSGVWFVEPALGVAPRVVSTDPLGKPAASYGEGVISGDGRWSVFTTVDPSVTPFDDNAAIDVIARSIDVTKTGPV